LAGPGAQLSYLWEYKRKRENFPKKKRGKGNFMRFICTAILLMIRKSRKSPKTLHYTYMIFWAVSIKKY